MTGLTIRQIRDNCARARHLMERSRQQHFAVGAFNIDDQETLIAVCRAGKAKQSPVLVEVSDGEVNAMGLDNIRDMVDNYRREYELEIYINLDHSSSVEDAKRGVDAGFEFIHIDISQANHEATREQIIAKTKEVVIYARFTGALLEAEERYFMGSSNVHKEDIDFEEVKRYMTKPDEAADFVTKTGIDTFAAQVGNLLAICMAGILYKSTSNCCSASATPSIAALVCMVAAVRPGVTLKKLRKSV